jgi:hypothetical protein
VASRKIRIDVGLYVRALLDIPKPHVFSSGARDLV